MGGVTLCKMPFYYSLLVLLLSPRFLQASQALNKDNYNEEKVPLTVIVPDPSPVQLSPLAAPPPVAGADDMPRLPSERWRSRSPIRSADAPAVPLEPWAGPAAAASPAFIASNPAVQLPRGVKDTATVLPMPAPGEERQDVGMATLIQARMVPLVVSFIMILSLWA